MALLVLAGLNAMSFHKYTFPSASAWSTHKRAPTGAKAAAVFSIVLWLGVIVAGRWLAY
jgi:uncharacterized membrane protein required for colicin V production